MDHELIPQGPRDGGLIEGRQPYTESERAMDRLQKAQNMADPRQKRPESHEIPNLLALLEDRINRARKAAELIAMRTSSVRCMDRETPTQHDSPSAGPTTELGSVLMGLIGELEAHAWVLEHIAESIEL